MRLISALIGCLLLSVTLPSGLTFHAPSVTVGGAAHFPVDNNSLPDSLASTSNFFAVRRDLRRCASPRCGGYFVSRVNQRWTRCHDGAQMQECYVATIDWNGHPETEPNRILLRGDLLGLSHRGAGRFGLLRVSEKWDAASDKLPTGDFFRVRDLGVRCITHPCLSHHDAKLNTTVSRKIAGVELNGVGATDERMSEAFKAMTSPDGILVSGSHKQVSGPGGRAATLDASQFYLQTTASVSLKPCIKTGCSRQVCADEEVVTTCEYRSEYECYKRAACERQRNGECGFTMTPQLRACLNRRRG